MKLFINSKIFKILKTSSSIVGKKTMFLLTLTLFINVFFEALSIASIIPFINAMVSPNFYETVSNYTLFNFKFDYFLGYLNINNEKELRIFLSLIFLFFFLLRIFFNLFTTWLSQKYRFKLNEFLCSKLFTGYVYSSYDFHLKKNSSVFFRNITGECSLFANSSFVLMSLINDSILVFSIITLLFFVNPSTTLVLLMILSITGFTIFKIFKNYLFNLGLTRQKLVNKTNRHLRETFDLIQEIKIFIKEKYFLKKFINYNYTLLNLIRMRDIVRILPRQILEGLSVVIVVGFIIIAAYSEKNFQNLIGLLSLYLLAGYRILPSLNKILTHLQSLKFSEPAIDLVISELSITNKAVNESNKIKKIESKFKFDQKIKFKKITFKYKNNFILNGLDLEIKKNAFTGIIGESGAGKSTFVKIMLGLLKPNSGKIFCDNTEITNLNYHEFRKKIGYVPQNVILQDESILKNIVFGEDEKNIDLERVNQVIDQVELRDFIDQLGDGLNSKVGERGKTVSGGQIQRIAIARAIYKKPEILILDESTNSLDPHTEEKILNTIKKNLGFMTVIIISHKESIMKTFANIFKFKQGGILTEIK